MKKTVITISIVLLFTLFFVLVFRYTGGAEGVSISESLEESSEVLAEEKTESEIKREEIKLYIKERIVPIVIGVLTSVSAILATLGAIKRALNSIGETKELFKNESKARDEKFQRESEYLTKKAEEIENALNLIPQLESEIATLEKGTEILLRECRDLAKMVSLGFSQDERVISSGNGQKISRLLSEIESSLPKTQAEVNNEEI